MSKSSFNKFSFGDSTLRAASRDAPNFDKWHPVKVLYHYMRLRAYEVIPETQRLVETLIKQPLSVLPASLREGHEGRVGFLKQCWEESKANEDIDQGWIEASIDALDDEPWEDLMEFALPRERTG
ncbi:MAG: hypothetical protein L6R40_000442 [Gallowayella cf. fulva]|nr:MAG: hypothetical protein L6R40_000442 [Xanthomendoza cf. fulva]